MNNKTEDVQVTSQNTHPEKLSKKDLLKAWIRCFDSEACYNYERMQALGNANIMLPIVDKLYNTKEEKVQAGRKYLEFFNTEPSWVGSVIQGISISMEEQKSNGADIEDDDIVSLRTGLMGPVAGIGDTISQAVVYPILAGICCQFSMDGSIIGPLMFFGVYTALMVFCSYNFFMLGYNKGKVAIMQMLASGMLDKVTETFSIIGLFIVGNMAYTRVAVNCPLEFQSGNVSVVVQDMFDTLIPGLIPLLITLGVWKLVQKKINPTIIILILFVVGIAGSYLGILGVA